jgi:pyruvate dehydrogenase E1 component beta subunit
MVGMRPIAELMTMNFGIVAMDQIVNHASKMRYMFGGRVTLPLVIRAPQGGGTQKGAQHSHSLESWLMNAPGIRVVLPSTPYDVKGLLKTAIRSDDPVLFLEHEMLYSTRGDVPEEEYLIPFGVAEVKRPGRDITIVAWSKMLLESLAAAETLAGEGIEAEVVDPRTLDPLDFDTIADSVARTRRAVIVEEGWRNVGVGAELAARIQETLFYELEAPVQRVAAADVPTPYAKNLEHLALPDAGRIVEAVLKVTL